MTIECYTASCKKHGIHEGEEGPFCFEIKCNFEPITAYDKNYLGKPFMKFKPGDRVQKVGGNYQAEGVIMAAFLVDDGTPRYVFKFDTPKGMLHIFNETQLDTLATVDKQKL